MSPLDKLLAPYRNAVQGTPTTTASMARDPVYESLLQASQSTSPNLSASHSSSEPGSGSLHPYLQGLLDRLPWLDYTSGVRTTAHQRELWEAALQKYGDPEIADNWVARPGTSNHEEGIAADVAQDDIARLLQFLANHPKWDDRITRPMSWEPWHFEVQRG